LKNNFNNNSNDSIPYGGANEKMLSNYIDSVTKISEESRISLLNCFKTETYPKKHLLVKQGQTVYKLYFIIKGVAREFSLIDGKEVTNWITCENEFVTSFGSFISGKPSFQSIDLIEDSILLSISRKDLYSQYERFPDLERFARLVVEKYYCWLEELYLFQKYNSAKEKYDALLEFNPEFINRFPLHYIASLLGVSLETVSRIRAGKPY